MSDVSATVLLLDRLGDEAAGETVPKAWAAWMGQHEWQWFVNLTFKEPIHPEQADKRYRRWLRWLNRTVYGVRAEKGGASVVHVRGLELQRRDVIHFHALMTSPENLNTLVGRFEAMHQWEKVGGGFARIFACDSSEAVRRYVAKYAAKGGDVMVGGPWGRVLEQRGLALG